MKKVILIIISALKAISWPFITPFVFSYKKHLLCDGIPPWFLFCRDWKHYDGHAVLWVHFYVRDFYNNRGHCIFIDADHDYRKEDRKLFRFFSWLFLAPLWGPVVCIPIVILYRLLIDDGDWD